MMDLATINRMAREAARVARGAGIVPYHLTAGVLESIRENGRFPFPNIGSYRPKGFKLVDTHFVDSSGLGRDDEPALTAEGFMRVLRVGCYYALIEAGQFQVVVGEFVKTS